MSAPGGYGTTSLTGRVGYVDWANPAGAAASANATTKAESARSIRIIGCAPKVRHWLSTAWNEFAAPLPGSAWKILPEPRCCKVGTTCARCEPAPPQGASAMRTEALFWPPRLSSRFVPVWRRNLLVWRKLAIASVLGNIADPLLYMLALGYGIGAFVPRSRRHEVHRVHRHRHGVPERDVHVELRGDVLGVLADARAAHLGGDHQRADRRSTTSCSPNGSGAASKAVISTIAILAVIMALGYGHYVARAVDPAARLPGRARVRRVRPRDECARAGLRFLHVLLHAGADADAAVVRRVLPGRPDAGVARRRRRASCRSSTRSTSRGR